MVPARSRRRVQLIVVGSTVVPSVAVTAGGSIRFPQFRYREVLSGGDEWSASVQKSTFSDDRQHEPPTDREETMKSPTQCLYWDRPELTRSMRDGFDLLDTYEEESHWRRCLLKCRECGQLYFYEFYEWINWEHGNDPQYITYVPVETEEEIETLRKTSSVELLQFFPRIQSDFPADANEPRIRWVTEPKC